MRRLWIRRVAPIPIRQGLLSRGTVVRLCVEHQRMVTPRKKRGEICYIEQLIRLCARCMVRKSVNGATRNSEKLHFKVDPDIVVAIVPYLYIDEGI